MNSQKHFIIAFAIVWIGLGIGSIAGYREPEFRPWEKLYDYTRLRFRAESQVSMHAIGDLGFKSWNRALQRPRETTFTTDHWGYRNPTNVPEPEIVVIGDSYVAGASQSDEETVTARLSDRLGAPVYNFATQVSNAPALFLAEPRFQQNPPKVVIWAPVARSIAARPLYYDTTEREHQVQAVDWRAALPDLVKRLNRDNGLTREARFLIQGTLDRWRGDPYLRQLPNGKPVLALSLWEQALLYTPEQRGVEKCIEIVSALDDILSQSGIRFIFSPVPESGSIYPEIFSEAEQRALPSDSFLDRLLAGVEKRGVETVDLQEAYRRERVPYLYQADDTHWSARASDLAAALFAERLGSDARKGVASRRP